MRAWLLMLAIFYSKNYIPVAPSSELVEKKNAQKKIDLTVLAKKRFTIYQVGQRLDLQPALIP